MRNRPATVLFIIGGVLFVLLGIAASQTDRVPGDLTILQQIQRVDWFEPIAQFFRVPVDDWFIPIATGALIVTLLVLRKYPEAAAFTTAWAGGLIVFGLKNVIGRERPGGDLIVHYTAGSHSFPSGHAFSAAIFATLIVWLAATYFPRPYALASAAAAVTFVLLAGISRVWLGVHWPSDIIGGWLLGALCGSAAWLIAHWLAPRIARPRS